MIESVDDMKAGPQINALVAEALGNTLSNDRRFIVAGPGGEMISTAVPDYSTDYGEAATAGTEAELFKTYTSVPEIDIAVFATDPLVICHAILKLKKLDPTHESH